MIYLLAFIFGACVGSFLNVCIYRVPRNINIVYLRSHCPQCQQKISWFDNIPLFSICFLRFRCRYCKVRIALRYPLVEVLAGLSAWLFCWQYLHSYLSFSYAVLSCLCVFALIVITFIDLDYMIIPNEITYVGMLLGLVLAPIFPGHLGVDTPIKGFVQSVIGLLVGGGFLYIVGLIAEWILKKEAMGMGDVKLLGMLGALYGWKCALLTIFLGSFIGSIIGFILIIKGVHKKGTHLPFGPYLALSAGLSILWGNQIISWYLGFVGIN